MQAKDFTDAALQPVTHDRSAQRFFHADTETAGGRRLLAPAVKHEKQFARATAPAFVDRVELAALQETNGARIAAARGRDVCGRLFGVVQGLYARLWTSSVRGNRASYDGGALWVERYASAMRPLSKWYAAQREQVPLAGLPPGAAC